MTPADIIILIVVTLLLTSIVYFSFIKPKIKHESSCHKCPYSKQCGSNAECEKNKTELPKTKTETKLEKTKKETKNK